MSDENENEFSVDTEQLKNETKDTVNQVKDTLKNTDFKRDAEETKGFLKEMIANPFEAIKRVASGEENALSKAIILMILFLALSLGYKVIYMFKYRRGIKVLIEAALNPIFYILVPAIIILMLNKENKKSLTTIISTLVITSIPYIASYVIDIFNILVGGLTLITSPINTMLSVTTTVLGYFGMKDLFEIEDDSVFIKKYLIIKLVVAFLLTVLSRIGIY